MSAVARCLVTPRQATCGHDTDDILRYGICTGLLFALRLTPALDHVHPLVC